MAYSFLGHGRGQHIVQLARTLVPRVAAEQGDGRTGGYLCFRDLATDAVFYAPMGKIDPLKREKYIEFCQEKALRLSRNQEHFSSWQSRVVSDSQYGGAIRTGFDEVLSFSGLPELVDEALCLAIAVIVGSLEHSAAEEIAALSSNPHFERVFQLACRRD